MSIEALAEGLNCLDHEVIFLGDGVAVYREKLEALLTIPFSFAPGHTSTARERQPSEHWLRFITKKVRFRRQKSTSRNT